MMKERGEVMVSFPGRDPAWVRWGVRLLVAFFIIWVSRWAFREGMRIRNDAWVNSRPIRFNHDIENAVRWGAEVLRDSEDIANNEPNPHNDPRPVATAHPAPNDPNQRGLTPWEVIQGVMQMYHDKRDEQQGTDNPNQDAALDYPPMRLTTMTIWGLWLENHYNGLDQWAQYPWAVRPRSSRPSEDMAQPMLDLNSACTAVSAVFMALLVAVWVWRGGRPNLPEERPRFSTRLNHFFMGKPLTMPTEPRPAAEASMWAKAGYWTRVWTKPWRRRLVPWKPVRFCEANGVILFPITLVALVYGATVVVAPLPSPPPVIGWGGRPSLSTTGDGSSIQATFYPVVDPQGAPAQWHLEWGTTMDYGNRTDDQDAGGGSGAQELSVSVANLPAKQTIHYRLVARNDQNTLGQNNANSLGRGTTKTDDASFNTTDLLNLTPMPSTEMVGAVWPTWKMWAELLLVFAAMAWAIRIMPPGHRAWACGIVAALLLWFDPGIIVDTHMWPQWDVWTLPPFLLTALLGSLDWWFAAGLVMGFGAFFKGQILFAAPVLAMWPLLSFQFSKALRLVGGFLLMTGIMVSPWFVWNPQRIGPIDWQSGAVRFIPCVAAACLVSFLLSLYRRPVYRRVRELWRDLGMDEMKMRFPLWRKTAHGAVTLPGHSPTVIALPATGAIPLSAAPISDTSLTDLITFCVLLTGGMVTVVFLLLRRWPSDAELPAQLTRVLLLLAVLIPPWYLRRRTTLVWAGMMIGLSLWMSAWLYHGDWSWKTVGYEFGTQKFADRMAMSPGHNMSFPAILESKFGWGVSDPAMTVRLPNLAAALHLARPDSTGAYTGWVHDYGLDGTPTDITMKTLLVSIYVIMLVLCGIAAALQNRKNDPKLLAALTATWAIFPNALTQMTSRYHMWGGAMAASLIAVAAPLVILQIMLGIFGAWMVFHQLVIYNPERSPALQEVFNRLNPDFGWVMLLSALVFLGIALSPGGRVKAEELAR